MGYVSTGLDLTGVDFALDLGVSLHRAYERNGSNRCVGHDDESPQKIRTRSRECHGSVTLDAPHYSAASAVQVSPVLPRRLCQRDRGILAGSVRDTAQCGDGRLFLN